MKNKLDRYLRDLTALGAKPCGSENDYRAAEYIFNSVKRFCQDTQINEFKFDGWQYEGSKNLEITDPIRLNLETELFLGSGSGISEGKIRYIGLNHVWNIYSWDRYAIIQNGKITGYISGRPEGSLLSQTLIEGNSELPHFIISAADNKILKELLLPENDVYVRGQAACSAVPDMTGYNVIAIIKGLNPKKKPIVVTTHRDTMYNTLGAYDNQAGCAVVMVLAEMLTEKKPDMDVIIAFTDGEECRLAGGKYLSKQIPADGIEYVLNIDGVGSGDEMEIWSGPEKFERLVMEQILNDGSIPKQCYRNPPPPGSDHTPFYEKGIPAVMLTFNDQDIIHSERDSYNPALIPNMEKMVNVAARIIYNLGGNNG